MPRSASTWRKLALPTEDPRDEWMTLGEIAAHLKLSRSKIYEMARQGTISCSNVAGRWRFLRSEVDDWMIRQRPSSASEPNEEAPE